MIEIKIPEEAIQEFADRTVLVSSDMGPIYEQLKKEFLQAHLLPIQGMYEGGAPLPVVYAYVKLKEGVEAITNGTANSLILDEETAHLVKASMEGFKNWSINMGELVLLAHKNLTLALGDTTHG